MTQEQFERWKDFSLRMARTCFAGSERPTAAWIAEEVEAVFGAIDENDIPVLTDWDSANEYPEGHPYHELKGEWPCEKGKDGVCFWRSGCDGGKHRSYRSADALCDFMREREWAFRDGEMWSQMTDAEYLRYEGLKEADEYEQVGEFLDDLADALYSPVTACVRAGLDMASAPSGGVCGFTAGDIRRMYPEGVPEWVFGDEPLEVTTFVGEVPGVGLIPGDTRPGARFADLPDDAEIWL